jgi:hypothetical protein
MHGILQAPGGLSKSRAGGMLVPGMVDFGSAISGGEAR